MENNQLILKNTEPFMCLVIKPNIIEDQDWTDPLYLSKLANSDFCNYKSLDPKKYVDFIIQNLLIEEDNPNIDVKVQIISESKNYIFEIMYVYVKEGPKDKINEFGTLLNINNDIIIGNVIITKTYISLEDNNMHYDNLTANDIEELLFNRANTKVIAYNSDDEEYKEALIFGPLDLFADIYFGEKKYNIKKKELAFLKHNINIWYTQDEYGNLDVCGNLLENNIRIDKMLVFSMLSDEYRCSLTLEEFNQIKELSKKMTDYIVSQDDLKDEKDELGRYIIKNKYKILYQYYKKYVNFSKPI
jgi:hypothetical protein